MLALVSSLLMGLSLESVFVVYFKWLEYMMARGLLEYRLVVAARVLPSLWGA